MDTFGWSAVANVHFTGWGVCQSGGNNGSLNLHFSYGGGGTSIPIGYPGPHGQISTTITISQGQSQFTLPSGGLLHEFGHVLGFAHEQDRPDNVPAGSPSGPAPNGGSYTGLYCDYQTDEVGGLTLTPYVDTQSVMSYCSQDALSAGDVAGVQALYGVGGSFSPMWQGQNSSNNAVARTPNNLDTFIAREDGSIWINSWFSDSGTYPWLESQVASGAVPNSPIAATARTPSNMDIFFAGADGAVHTAAWQDGSAWFLPLGGELPGTASLVQPGEQVAAVTSTPGTADVFYAGTDGNLYWSHWWFTGGWFGNPVQVISDGSVPVGAAVSAVARTPDDLDVFYVDTNGVPHTAYCAGSSGPHSCYTDVYNHEPTQAGNWASFPIPTSPSCQGLPGTGIAAAARSAVNIDLFYSNSSGTMCTSYWNPGANWGTPAAPNSYPFGYGRVANPEGFVSVVARSPSNLDAFFVALDGGLYNAWWNAQANGVQDFELNGPGLGRGIARVGSPVGVTGRTPNNLDVFAGGAHGVTTAYWATGATTWNGYSIESPLWFTSELSVDNHSPAVNAGVNLNVTVSGDVGPTPYYIYIVDATTSQIIASCGSGTTCNATATNSTATTHVFRAYLSEYSAAPPMNTVISATEAEYVTWNTSGYRLQLAPNPLVFTSGTGTVTATSSINVGPTPYFITLYDTDSGEILAACGWGTTCQATASFNTQHVVAFIDTYGSSLSAVQAQAASNTIVVNPG